MPPNSSSLTFPINPTSFPSWDNPTIELATDPPETVFSILRLDINSLNEGQIISVNNSIQLKVTLVKDACASISYNDPDVIKKLQGNMYVFVTPLETGYISINDEIEILWDLHIFLL